MSTAESEEAMPASILAIEYAVDSEASLDVDISHIPAHYCELCGQSFSRSSVLLKHQRNIHKQDVVTPFTLTCSICKEGLCSSARYASHLLEKHQIQVVVNKFSCSDLAAFEAWKVEMEQESLAFFVKLRGSPGSNKFLYCCNRSGSYKPDVSNNGRQRKLRKQGTAKIGGKCPARIDVEVEPVTGLLNVVFTATHVGHDMDVNYLPMTIRADIQQLERRNGHWKPIATRRKSRPAEVRLARKMRDLSRKKDRGEDVEVSDVATMEVSTGKEDLMANSMAVAEISEVAMTDVTIHYAGCFGQSIETRISAAGAIPLAMDAQSDCGSESTAIPAILNGCVLCKRCFISSEMLKSHLIDAHKVEIDSVLLMSL